MLIFTPFATMVEGDGSVVGEIYRPEDLSGSITILRCWQ